MNIILRSKINNQYLAAANNLLINYNFTKGSKIGSTAMLNAQRRAITLIGHFFTPIKALSSKPVIEVRTDSIIITVFYYVEDKQLALNDNTINNLGDILGKLFKRPVELRFVKLPYPYLNRMILAKYISKTINKKKFRWVILNLLKDRPVFKFKDFGLMEHDPTQVLPAIQGIKFKVSGRPLSQRARPRKTIIKKKVGTFYKDHKTSFIEYRKYISKNKRGAYTVKVWISQLLYLKP